MKAIELSSDSDATPRASTSKPVKPPKDATHKPKAASPSARKPVASSSKAAPSKGADSAKASSSKSVLETLKEKHSDSLANNWELSVVWAFLFRFAPLGSSPFMPQTIEELEAAVSADEDAARQDPDQVSLGHVLTWMARMASGGTRNNWAGGTKTWRHFVSFYVDVAFEVPKQIDLHTIWDGENLVRTDASIYGLEIPDRIHLLRLITDYLLNKPDNNPIRDKVEEMYHIGKQQVAHHTYDKNPLVVEPLGLDPANRSNAYLHLDDSPNIFFRGNQFKRSAPWLKLCNTREELDALAEEIAGPAAVPTKQGEGKKKQASIFDKPNKAARGMAALRTEIDERVLPKLESQASRLRANAVKREKLRAQHAQEIADRAAAAEEEAEAERQVDEAKPSPLGKRKRLRATTKADYVYSSDQEDDEDGPSTRGQRKKARDGDADLWELSEDERPRRNGQRVGERRSTRLRGGDDDDPVAEVARYERRYRSTSERVPLPAGAREADYNLEISSDEEIAVRGRSKLIKGRRTARAENAAAAAAAQDEGEGEEDASSVAGVEDSMDTDAPKVASSHTSFEIAQTVDKAVAPGSESDFEPELEDSQPAERSSVAGSGGDEAD